jgi:hypothetical protein
LLVFRFVMSKETAGSSVTVMGGMIVDFLQSAIRLSNLTEVLSLRVRRVGS